MDRAEFVAVLASISLLLVTVELVRRRHLATGYSLLWFLTSLALLILSTSRNLLEVLAQLMGIFYPPAALFVVGGGFILLILFQFSAVVSRLSRENKRLAQELGLLNWRLSRLESNTMWLSSEHVNDPDDIGIDYEGVVGIDVEDFEDQVLW